MTRPSLIDLNHDEYNQELCYYPCMVNLGRRNENCNTSDILSIRICVPHNIEEIILSVFNLIKFKQF